LINFISFLLQINRLSYAVLPEKVVAATDTFLEPQPYEQAAQIPEVDVGIRFASRKIGTFGNT